MEDRKLPNGTLSLVLGIISFLCCCVAGIGIIPAGIALFLATKAEKMGNANPDQYDNLNQIKTAKIVALIAVIINALYMIWTIYRIATVGWDQIMEDSRAMQEQWGM